MTEKKSLLQKNWMVILCALCCTALWGSAFPCIKTGYAMLAIGSDDIAEQILFAGIRFFGAGVLALIMGSAGQKRVLIPQKKSWWMIGVLAIFQTVVQYLLFYVGLAHTTGVKGSILQGTGTLFSLLIACLIFRTESLTSRKLIGCLIGFAGIIMVNFTGAGMDLSMTFLGEGFMILATLSSSFSAVFLKQFSRHENPVTLSSYQFMVGGAVMVVIGLASGGRITGFTAPVLLLLLYMCFISAAAYSLWGILLKHNPVSKITAFSFTIELFGVVFSTIILKEQDIFGWNMPIALALVCVGIFLVTRKHIEKQTKA